MSGRAFAYLMGVLCVAGLAAAEALLRVYAPGASLLRLFEDAILIPRLVMTLSLLCTLLAVVFILQGPRTQGALTLLAFGLPVLGFFAALYGAALVRVAGVVSHASFKAEAPGYAQMLLTLGLACLAGCVAAFGRARLRRSV